MHAVTTSGPGDVDVLAWSEVPDPVPAAGEVVIDIVASAVNRADLLQRMGFYPPPPGASDILGLECSGTVSAVADDVTTWQVGDNVCALLAGGGYAEKVAVPAGQCMPIPAGVDVVAAAGLPEVAATVWANVVQVGRLTAGEAFLVHGGGSGIGTMAIQVTAALGASPVACTVGSTAKGERCRRLGADLVIDYTAEDFVELVRASNGRGADLVLDIMGAAYLARNVDVLAPDGRLVVIGLQGGVKAELDLNALLRKRGSLHATSLRGRTLEQKASICADVVAELWPLVESGRVHPVVAASYPMTEVGAAHQRVQDGRNVGKVLLTVPGRQDG